MPKFKEDPYRAREAQRYEHPIPSREYILEFLRNETSAPVTEAYIATCLELSENQQEALNRRIRAMERDGQLVRTRKNRVGLPERMNLVRGRVLAHPEGYGFLQPDEPGRRDLLLSPREMRQVMHMDRVVGRLSGVDKRGRPEGAIVRIVERGQHRIVGRFHLEDGISFVAPEEKRIHQNIFIPPGEEGGARTGEIVMVEVTRQPDLHREPTGRIIEIIGSGPITPDLEVEIVLRKHGIPHEWPKEVLEEAEQVPQTLDSEGLKNREDLRTLPLITIDGSDARDFDDAVFAERIGEGFRLIVAIADVSYYVARDSHLDKEAYRRGNSTYFPNRVVPMLPEALSNGICSLNPGVDRFVLACEMHIDNQGEVEQYRFFEAVMHSHARLTYHQVAAMMEDGDETVRSEFAALVPHLEILYALYRYLHHARVQRGALEFEGVETKVVFGEDNRIETIVPYERREAHRLIEECMLAANESAAQLFDKLKEPVLYRVHEPPSEEKLDKLRDFLKAVGLDLGHEDPPSPKAFCRVLEQARMRRDAHLLEFIMLRSLKQAHYNPENKGHFGLSYPSYTHFTSPIRRYPDLVVHRRIKDLLSGRRVKEEAKAAFRNNLAKIGEHTSTTERQSEDAEREVIDWMKCQYMQDHLGESYEGIISGVTGFGIFVELAGVYTEGLVHVSNLEDDYYHFDPVHHKLQGERTHRVYQLADPVQVQVTRVDIEELKIDLALIKAPDEIGQSKT